MYRIYNYIFNNHNIADPNGQKSDRISLTDPPPKTKTRQKLKIQPILITIESGPKEQINMANRCSSIHRSYSPWFLLITINLIF